MCVRGGGGGNERMRKVAYLVDLCDSGKYAQVRKTNTEIHESEARHGNQNIMLNKKPGGSFK